MLKQLILLFTAGIMAFSTAFSQGQMPLEVGAKQLNFGLSGTNSSLPLYIGLDFAIHKDITIGGVLIPQFWNNSSSFIVAAVGDYHFNTLLDIPGNFDFYGGLELGFGFWRDNIGDNSGPVLDMHLGGRYYWNDAWGINIELGGGSFFGGKLGLSKKF